jgi:hypothetical protein
MLPPVVCRRAGTKMWQGEIYVFFYNKAIIVSKININLFL